jgi:hypothetical protein
MNSYTWYGVHNGIWKLLCMDETMSGNSDRHQQEHCRQLIAQGDHSLLEFQALWQVLLPM